MRDASTIIRERQLVIRRELERRNIAMKAVSFDSGIPYPTLLSYFPGGEKIPAEMPAGAIYSLCGALPSDLLSLLLPDGFAIIRVPEGVDYDEFSRGCREFLDAKDRAHHPDSEAGRDIGPGESVELGAQVVRLRA